jgi:pSer/pThr/pTyr-binding forkhead associated (FHA) protein
LFIVRTARLVRLPHEGKIVLGRFEYGVEDPPDVDLTFDDLKAASVSQHHACIIGKGGRHWVEDLGSSSGTFLNNRRLPIGEKAQLSQGDQILLGECRVLYEPHPHRMLKPDPYAPHASLLVVTHTGQQIVLPHSSVMMIGRPDPIVGYKPDIDLSVAGKVASHVSRHHARMILRDGWHLVEDAGSSTGTRVNGSPIYRNDAPVRLHPGDQLWLGGCVLAYDWQPG